MKHSLIGLLLLSMLLPLVTVADAAGDQEVLQLAREVIQKVRYGALITIGEEGQPRSRIVDAFPPDENFVIYVATKPNTRKIQQIKNNSKTTLFYFDSEGRNYVSVMGSATLVNDEAVKRAMRREADSDRIYPDFPNDYLLIRIETDVVEGLLPGYRGDRETWMPARVELEVK
jgi:general stress protein 26